MFNVPNVCWEACKRWCHCCVVPSSRWILKITPMQKWLNLDDSWQIFSHLKRREKRWKPYWNRTDGSVDTVFFQDSHDLGWLPLANERFWPKNHFSLFSTLFPPKFISGHPLTTLWWNLSKIRTPGLLDKLMMMAMPEIWWQFLPTKSKIERQNTF